GKRASDAMADNCPVKVAVVTGGHFFDVPNFHRLFRAVPGTDVYIQHMEDFASSPAEVRDAYDVVLFYIMLTGDPTDEGLPWYAGKPGEAIERLGETGQSIFVLHHAILAYPDWPIWYEISGVRKGEFGYRIGDSLRIQVADGEHPITSGLSDWEMTDEMYEMNSPGEDSHVLLTTDHPRSMKTIAWTRRFKGSRVFCLQSGHDNDTWVDANFCELLRRGILWCAGTI
ncbi:MAG: ThuA domain-containing protein, partial [Phycisphaerae bacterium]|nr:ThuA domain-containing protein [Phycisphaerae bacterium]